MDRVWFTWPSPAGHRMERFGDVGREEVRLRSVKVALDLLQQALARHD